MHIFRAIVEAVLTYGVTAWILTETLESKREGTYTRALRAILNMSWRQHHIKSQLYVPITDISTIFLRERRMRIERHY